MPPYTSDQQRKFFNANKTALERKGVDVDEWNKASKGMNLVESKKHNKKLKK